jgi:hypothetical protein
MLLGVIADTHMTGGAAASSRRHASSGSPSAT